MSSPKKQKMNEGYSVGDPTAAVVAPGKCQFTDEWVECKLKSKARVSADTFVFTFGLPDDKKPLNLPTCACILASLDDVVRPYTPVSTNAMVGAVELMIKIYPNGTLTPKLDNLKVGDGVKFKHIEKNVKIQYPFERKTICMVVGGTGITPMIQALHAILGSPGDKTEVKMLYGSRVSDNILGEDFLTKWQKAFKSRFTFDFVLSEEPKESSWKGARGFIDAEKMEKMFPPPESDVKIFVCGPPPMYNALCGPRDDEKLSGALADMGYKKDQVYKF